MSEFFNAWKGCMDGSSFPVPAVEDVNESLEFLHKLHDAWEQAGADEELLFAGLVAAAAAGTIALGPEVGGFLAEAAGQIGQAVVLVYLTACIACLGNVAIDRIRDLFAAGQVPDFIVAELKGKGYDLNTAVG